ncbi:MAG TPA: histidine kinase dimerization/phospho-acceptor domain-containing protein [Pyrinomonadaceae bacterium]|nr:histidine kinase dimerization/phospho-acceptor domain-containing protein [Pyrinomonadaceae bacterium]
MSEAVLGRGGRDDAREGDLHALSAEVVDLFYAQAFSPGEIGTEQDICRAFTQILLRHWNLCCIVTFLQADDGRLHESAFYTHPHLDPEPTLAVGKLIAEAVEEQDAECQVWLDREEDDDCSDGTRRARRALAELDLRAGLGVPIHARGGLVGVLVAVSSTSERLRAAARGVRFVAAPIVIAIGNARRAAAVREQREHIEHLVEELRQRSAELEAANVELWRVGRYRSLFLARMSHELRTPLTSILGFAEILLDHEDLSASQRRYCEKIQASGFQLKASLNQLVDLSRLEAGQTELFLHEFSLRETLRDSCAVVGRLAQKQEVTLELDAPPELGTIVSDEGKLRQVLYNFLANAIARSPAGGRVRALAETTGRRFRVEITDEGEPLQDLSQLFAATDVDAPNERGTNMNELGLVIAHRLISVLGGTVRLGQAGPRGLTAQLDFPARPTEET